MRLIRIYFQHISWKETFRYKVVDEMNTLLQNVPYFRHFLRWVLLITTGLTSLVLWRHMHCHVVFRTYKGWTESGKIPYTNYVFSYRINVNGTFTEMYVTWHGYIIRKLFWGLFMGLGGQQNNHQIFPKLLDTMYLTINYHLIIGIIW